MTRALKWPFNSPPNSTKINPAELRGLPQRQCSSIYPPVHVPYTYLHMFITPPGPMKHLSRGGVQPVPSAARRLSPSKNPSATRIFVKINIEICRRDTSLIRYTAKQVVSTLCCFRLCLWSIVASNKIAWSCL